MDTAARNQEMIDAALARARASVREARDDRAARLADAVASGDEGEALSVDEALAAIRED